MIRITTSRGPAGCTISVDGEVAGEYVDVVDSFVKQVNQASGGEGPISLYLREVTAIDEGGRALLDRLAGNGIRLRAQGVYWSYIVAEINRRHDVPKVA